MEQNKTLIVEMAAHKYNLTPIVNKMVEEKIADYLALEVIDKYIHSTADFFGNFLYHLSNNEIFGVSCYVDDNDCVKRQIAVINNVYADDKMTKKIPFSELNNPDIIGRSVYMDYKCIMEC